jgi:hypothetical protein
MSASRLYVMDLYELRSDPCDNKMIRLTNCMMLMACVCDCLVICIKELRECAFCLRAIANCVFYCTLGCMAGQVNREVLII